MTIWPLLSILWWVIVGWWIKFVFDKIRYQVYRVRLLPHFGDTAPTWWLEVNHYQWIWNATLTDGVPNYSFGVWWRGAAKVHFDNWVSDKANRAADLVRVGVRAYVGFVQHAYVTFEDWIEAIGDRVGDYIPWWADDLVDAAVKLYDWFPTDIVNAWKSWGTIWAEIKGEVWAWALARFDAAKDWVANNAPWVIDWINFLVTWYNAVGVWVTNFKGDPFGTVTGWLGIAWTTWTGIRVGILKFYNTVWVPFSTDLHDFLDHPMLFLYDVFDDEADNYVETLSRWVGRVAEKIIVWAWRNS